MTAPLSMKEQVTGSFFIPEHKLVVYFATNEFDEVYRDWDLNDKSF